MKTLGKSFIFKRFQQIERSSKNPDLHAACKDKISACFRQCLLEIVNFYVFKLNLQGTYWICGSSVNRFVKPYVMSTLAYERNTFKMNFYSQKIDFWAMPRCKILNHWQGKIRLLCTNFPYLNHEGQKLHHNKVWHTYMSEGLSYCLNITPKT